MTTSEAKKSQVTSPPLMGLILLGGYSQRMGRDKAWLEYGGRLQPLRAEELLRPHCEAVFFSHRRGQELPGALDSFAKIEDPQQSNGPMTGLMSAFQYRPDCAWFVLACDLPFLDSRTVGEIIRARQHQNDGVTPFVEESMPQPTCSIYEPSCQSVLYESLQQKRFSLKKMIQELSFCWVPIENSRPFRNVNSWEQHIAAREELEA